MPVELVLIKYNLMSNKIDHKHMGQGIQEWTKKNLCKTAFKKIWNSWLPKQIIRSYYFKFFKGCLSQILLGLFLNTLTHVELINVFNYLHVLKLCL